MTRELTQADLDAIYHAAIAAHLRSTMDPENEEPLDENHGPEDLTTEASATLRAQIEAFTRDNADDLSAALAVDGLDYSLEQFGHDLTLTRNRHGAGFWDRGLGSIGVRLTDAAHNLGEADLYPTEDGQLAL